MGSQDEQSDIEHAGIEDEPGSAATVFGDGIESARRYVDALAGDGVIRGLIGPRETARMWTRHLLNSAVVGALLAPGSTVVDIGSGAGLPGIPLAIARPDCTLVLVEPLERRTVFLHEVVLELGLNNCRVVRGVAAQVVDECGDADVVTSRAVAPLAKLAAWSAPLLRVGGAMLALKGSSAGAEIVRDRRAVTLTGIGDLTIVSAGAGLVDPATTVIRGVRVADRGRGAAKRQKHSTPPPPRNRGFRS